MNIIFIYSLIGIFVSMMLGIEVLNKQTPQLSRLEALKEYFRMNLWRLLAGVALTFVIVQVSINGDSQFLVMLNLNPTLSIGTGFILGFGVLSLVGKLTGLIGSPPEIKTVGEKIKEVNKTGDVT